LNERAGCKIGDGLHAPRNSVRYVAPELLVERWFNTDVPITLAGLRGKTVVIHAFQMLCPGCVAHSIPQARRLHDLARGTELVVLGLHTVFEHHAAMTPVALEAFLYEYRITFPVGIDQSSDDGPIPKTMATYGLRGTPSTLIIDREGYLVRHTFGAEDDLALGMLLGFTMQRDPARSEV
jgi:peroxiredoxin